MTYSLGKTSNWEKILSWFVFLCFSTRILLNFYIARSRVFEFGSFEVSDWLINYEGGFVRRGIIGQILYELTRIHLYDVRIAIYLIICIASVAMLFLLFHIFKKEGWSLLLLPTGLCVGYTLFGCAGRRDLVSLLITFTIFLVYRRLRTNKNHIAYRMTFYIVSIFQLLIHEAAFFYTFPILMLDWYQQARTDHTTILKSILSCLCNFSPVLLAMLFVCLFKGNTETANRIWTSWNNLFMAYSTSANEGMGSGVYALTWNFKDTAINHLHVAYLGYYNPSYWRILFVPFNLIASYFLFTRVNSVSMGLYKKRSMNHVFMSNIVIVQFIFMIPMFTVLSCDWGRTIPYWGISSLFAYHIFKDTKMHFFCGLTNFSSKVQNSINENKVLSSPFLYILLIFITPVPIWNAPEFTFEAHNTIQYLIFFIAKKFITTVSSLL